MRSCGLRIAMLAFVVVWFGVLLPVHTRGQVPLLGDCPQCKVCHRCDRNSCPQPQVPARPKSCAICYLIATLDLPPALIIYVPEASAGQIASPVLLEQLSSQSAARTCSERGPPAPHALA